MRFRQTDRQRHRDRDRQTETDRNRKRDREIETQTERDRDRQTDRDRDTETDRQTETETDRNRKRDREIETQVERQRQTDRLKPPCRHEPLPPSGCARGHFIKAKPETLLLRLSPDVCKNDADLTETSFAPSGITPLRLFISALNMASNTASQTSKRQ